MGCVSLLLRGTQSAFRGDLIRVSTMVVALHTYAVYIEPNDDFIWYERSVGQGRTSLLSDNG